MLAYGRRGFRFKLKALPKIEAAFRTMAGHASFVWDKALRLNLDRMERREPIVRQGDLCG